jgi:hypothetical protein
MKKTILNESVVGLEEVKLHVVLQSLGLVGSDAFEHETSVRLRRCRATGVQEVYRVAKLQLGFHFHLTFVVVEV